MKKKVTFGLLALLMVGAVATAAVAYGPGRGPGFGFGGYCGGFGGPASLNLTGDQQTKIDALRESHWKDAAPLREQMFSKRDALRKLWLEPNPDKAKIEAAQKELRALRDQMQDKGTAYRLEKLKVLTPEQKEKLAAFAGAKGFGPGSYGRGSKGGARGSYGRGVRGPGGPCGPERFGGGYGPRGNW